MSILGVTHWFSTKCRFSSLFSLLSFLNRPQGEKNLVLEKYTIEFVLQLRDQERFLFQNRIFLTIIRAVLARGVLRPVGSLLPFGPGLPKSYIEMKSSTTFKSHPSLDTWTVQQTGSVRIIQAGRASSTEENRQDEIPAVIFAPVIGDETGAITVQISTPGLEIMNLIFQIMRFVLLWNRLHYWCVAKGSPPQCTG